MGRTRLRIQPPGSDSDLAARQASWRVVWAWLGAECQRRVAEEQSRTAHRPSPEVGESELTDVRQSDRDLSRTI